MMLQRTKREVKPRRMDGAGYGRGPDGMWEHPSAGRECYACRFRLIAKGGMCKAGIPGG